MNPRQKLLMALRKQVKVQTRMGVEHRGGQIVRCTCQACGWFDEGPYLVLAMRRTKAVRLADLSEEMIRRRVAYENPCHGICQRCTREAQDRRYPLVS